MQTRGELRIDPGLLGTDAFSGELELVVPYTDPDLARALLRKAAALTAGLQACISLVAVHAVPFPADFHCPASTHAFLVDQLTAKNATVIKTNNTSSIGFFLFEVQQNHLVAV